MDDEKRMAKNYEITQAIYIGDKEVVMGIDETNDMPYFCAFFTENELYGSYSDCVIGDDYVEIVELFSDRIKEQCQKVREEQEKVPEEKIKADMCLPLTVDTYLEGKVVAIKENCLRPEYRTAQYQLVLVTGGNGAKRNARGRSCFCTELYSGEKTRFYRQDIQGEVKPECLPQWAKERLEEIKESALTISNKDRKLEER